MLFIIANFIGELTTVLFKKQDVALKNPLPYEEPFSVGGFCGVHSASYGDMDTWLEILKSGKDMVFMSEILSAFRKHAAQNTYNPNTRITLPLDALNFITVAWLNDAFFRNADEFHYCLDKWPIMAHRWYVPIKEDDPEIIKKRKEWIVKLVKVFEKHNYAEMLDASISYLLECVPFYLNTSLITRNNNGLWQKKANNFLELNEIDEMKNSWIGFNNFSVSKKNAKFGKTLQTNSGGIYCRSLEFGGADFTIGFFAKMDSETSSYCCIFNACSSFNTGVFIRPYDITLARYEENNTLRFGVTDSQSKWQVLSDEINFNPCDELHYYEIDYHHANRTVEFFGDNQLLFSHTGFEIERVPRYVSLGFLLCNMADFSYSSIDEFFILDGICRSSGTCTPPTEPFEVTENTLSLLRFDNLNLR